eukprot:XP_014033933.1 PREDICTED: nanos homolog 2-like [Salmo salar]
MQSSRSVYMISGKITTMQRNLMAESSLAPTHYFDMWHDYMNLGRLLEKLCDVADRTATTCTQLKEHGPDAEDHQTGRQDQQWFRLNSIGTESLSSASSISGNTSHSLASGDYCGFCKQNGETAEIFRSHKLKSKDSKVICPILRSYICPMCGGTGDNAHTRRYCPQRNGVVPKYWGTGVENRRKINL